MLKIMIPYLSSTDVAKICYKVRMDEPVNGTVVKNTAQVSCDNLVPDQDLSDLSDNEIVYVNTPKLQMNKTTLTPEIHVGQQARFQIDVENIVTGSIAGVPVVLEDTLPEGLSFVPGSIEISGLPDEISYPVRDEEKTGSATEVRDNRAIISENAEGRSFSISIPYLPSGCKVTVTYAATSLDSSNGYHLVSYPSLKAWASGDNCLIPGRAPDPHGFQSTRSRQPTGTSKHNTPSKRSQTPRSKSLGQSGYNKDTTLNKKTTRAAATSRS